MLDNPFDRYILRVSVERNSSIPQNSHPVGNASDLFHPMTDVQDSNTLTLKPNNLFEEQVDLGVGERGRRLIQY